MKRVNKTTETAFKRGDIREDGFIFFAYTKVVKSNGFFKEIWLSPEKSDRIKRKDKEHKKKVYQRKSDRKPPGYHDLPLREQMYIDQLARVEKYKQEYPDWTQADVDEMMLGY